MPARLPVINLCKFVDSRIFLYYRQQLKNIIDKNKISKMNDIIIPITCAIKQIICPLNIPVHLLYNRIREGNYIIFMQIFMSLDST